MRMQRVALLRAAVLGCVVLAGAVGASADSVNGVPVTGIGSNTQAVPNCPTLEGQVCYNATTGQIGFFIPLSSTTSGVYGTTAVPGGTSGTFADSGSGTTNALVMYLLFSPVAIPAQTATLTFSFVDLDLSGVNDPNYFFEAIQFFAADGSTLTPLITANGQSGGPLAFTVSGNSTSQTIFFPDVLSILTDPFYIELRFGSQWNQRGTNTIEKLTATLETTPVPEPGTMLLLGSGLVAVWARRRRTV